MDTVFSNLATLFSFSRASWAMDLTAIGLLLVLPLLAYSINLGRAKKKFHDHKKIQLLISIVLGIVIILFEIDVRMSDWRPRAATSPYFETSLFPVLYVHLAFSISTAVLWLVTLIGALRRFNPIPRANSYSSKHRLLGWATAIGMFGTAVTGWCFYWLGFIAS